MEDWRYEYNEDELQVRCLYTKTVGGVLAISSEKITDPATGNGATITIDYTAADGHIETVTSDYQAGKLVKETTVKDYTAQWLGLTDIWTTVKTFDPATGLLTYEVVTNVVKATDVDRYTESHRWYNESGVRVRATYQMRENGLLTESQDRSYDPVTGALIKIVFSVYDWSSVPLLDAPAYAVIFPSTLKHYDASGALTKEFVMDANGQVTSMTLYGAATLGQIPAKVVVVAPDGTVYSEITYNADGQIVSAVIFRVQIEQLRQFLLQKTDAELVSIRAEADRLAALFEQIKAEVEQEMPKFKADYENMTVILKQILEEMAALIPDPRLSEETRTQLQGFLDQGVAYLGSNHEEAIAYLAFLEQKGLNAHAALMAWVDYANAMYAYRQQIQAAATMEELEVLAAHPPVIGQYPAVDGSTYPDPLIKHQGLIDQGNGLLAMANAEIDKKEQLIASVQAAINSLMADVAAFRERQVREFAVFSQEITVIGDAFTGARLQVNGVVIEPPTLPDNLLTYQTLAKLVWNWKCQVEGRPEASVDFSAVEIERANSLGLYARNLEALWVPGDLTVLTDAELQALLQKLTAAKDVVRQCSEIYGAEWANQTLRNAILGYVQNFDRTTFEQLLQAMVARVDTELQNAQVQVDRLNALLARVQVEVQQKTATFQAEVGGLTNLLNQVLAELKLIMADPLLSEMTRMQLSMFYSESQGYLANELSSDVSLYLGSFNAQVTNVKAELAVWEKYQQELLIYHQEIRTAMTVEALMILEGRQPQVGQYPIIGGVIGSDPRVVLQDLASRGNGLLSMARSELDQGQVQLEQLRAELTARVTAELQEADAQRDGLKLALAQMQAELFQYQQETGYLSDVLSQGLVELEMLAADPRLSDPTRVQLQEFLGQCHNYLGASLQAELWAYIDAFNRKLEYHGVELSNVEQYRLQMQAYLQAIQSAQTVEELEDLELRHPALKPVLPPDSSIISPVDPRLRLQAMIAEKEMLQTKAQAEIDAYQPPPVIVVPPEEEPEPAPVKPPNHQKGRSKKSL
ncbi:MAG: hypothetical protein KTQ49_02040 [Candidatus Omnitrophica bacterium]|nr:hypothetical protein [Candidatus Omnitrophota bacterium]